PRNGSGRPRGRGAATPAPSRLAWRPGGGGGRARGARLVSSGKGRVPRCADGNAEFFPVATASGRLTVSATGRKWGTGGTGSGAAGGARRRRARGQRGPDRRAPPPALARSRAQRTGQRGGSGRGEPRRAEPRRERRVEHESGTVGESGDPRPLRRRGRRPASAREPGRPGGGRPKRGTKGTCGGRWGSRCTWARAEALSQAGRPGARVGDAVLGGEDGGTTAAQGIAWRRVRTRRLPRGRQGGAAGVHARQRVRSGRVGR